MGKIKKIFAKFLWNYPQAKILSGFISFLIAVGFGGIAVFGWFGFPDINLTRWILGLTGVSIFCFLYFFLLVSLQWRFELPEYVISEAQKILQNNPNLTQLNFLIEQVKRTEKADELKEWMEEYSRYNTLNQYLPKLRKQLEDIPQEIFKTESEIKELRQKLNI